MPSAFDEAARAWMREFVRGPFAPRDCAGELAQRCALAYGVASEGGLGSCLDRIAQAVLDENAAEAARWELAVIRVRNHGRTYWMVSNGDVTRTYAPHVAQRDAITRYEEELRVQYARVVVHRAHHRPEDAAALVARTFGGN